MIGVPAKWPVDLLLNSLPAFPLSRWRRSMLSRFPDGEIQSGNQEIRFPLASLPACQIRLARPLPAFLVSRYRILMWKSGNQVSPGIPSCFPAFQIGSYRSPTPTRGDRRPRRAVRHPPPGYAPRRPRAPKPDSPSASLRLCVKLLPDRQSCRLSLRLAVTRAVACLPNRILITYRSLSN